MPTPIARGELADRLRAVGRLTGRIPLQLDESVVPVLNIASLDEPPYRLGPRRFARHDAQGAIAAEFAFSALALPPATPGSFIIEQLWIRNAAATAQDYQLMMTTDANLRATMTGANSGVDVERPDLNSWIAAAETEVPVQVMSGSHATVLGVALIFLHVTGNSTYNLKDLGIRVPSGLAFACWTNTVNVNNITSWLGTYYPDL